MVVVEYNRIEATVVVVVEYNSIVVTVEYNSIVAAVLVVEEYLEGVIFLQLDQNQIVYTLLF